jgi:uncharacterized protein related to proFAR isomerase
MLGGREADSSLPWSETGARQDDLSIIAVVRPGSPMLVVPYLELEGRTLIHRTYALDEMSEFASKLSDKFKRAYVADIDGIARNKPQLDVVREICEEIPTLYEGGVRFAPNVIDMLITGAEKCVVGTATMHSLDDLRGAFKLSENITFKVDFRDGIVSFDPHIAGRALLDLSRDVTEMGVSEIVVPMELASEAVAAKEGLGFSLGVFAPVDERSRMERLGVDYIISGDYGRLMGNERA